MNRINIQDIKCGDTFWECDATGNVAFEAMADAVTRAGVVWLQGRNVATGEPQAFMMRLDHPQYAPSLYDAPVYRVPGESQ